MNFTYTYAKLGLVMSLFIMVSNFFGQSPTVENCCEVKTEQTLIQEKSELSSSKEILPVNKYEKSIVVESTKGSSKTILITDKDVQTKMSNKEFRDQFTALFGVERVQVSLSEPLVRITILADHAKDYLINHLGFTEKELKNLNF